MFITRWIRDTTTLLREFPNGSSTHRMCFRNTSQHRQQSQLGRQAQVLWQLSGAKIGTAKQMHLSAEPRQFSVMCERSATGTYRHVPSAPSKPLGAPFLMLSALQRYRSPTLYPQVNEAEINDV